MENLDVILLTIAVVVSFVVFIITSVKEFSRMKEEPYEYEKASGFTRAALFDALSTLFDDEEIPEKSREKYKSTIKRTISDMETDGVYFEKIDEKDTNSVLPKKRSGNSKKKNK